MASFFQLLRDRILNRAFIILQRQPIIEHVEESQDDKSVNSDTDMESNAENLSIDAAAMEELNYDDAGEIEQAATHSIPDVPKKEFADKVKKTDDPERSGTTESKKFKVDLESYYSDMKNSNSLEIRCDSVLKLAVSLSQDSPDVEVTDCLAVLKYLSDSTKYPHLAVCHSLLLCAFTRMSMSLAELSLLEERILSLAESLKKKDLANRPEMYKIEVLAEHHHEIAIKLCQEIFCDDYSDVRKIDISTICCSSLNNLSAVIKHHDNELGASYNFRNSTIKYILGWTGKSTQEIVSENISSSYQNHCPSISSHRIKLCLQVLEHALAINPDLSYCESLNHESFSLPHCLTRLLGWSASHVFPSKNNFEVTDHTYFKSDTYFKFHHSTLICILKILSVLTFNPEMYDSFTNVKGLMEKILICALKAYFESENHHFDIQVLCLEMLINLYIKNQKTFVLLCLKKFRISEAEEVLAVEALLKMLSDNLEKIKEVKEAPYSQVKNETTATPTENAPNEDATKQPEKDATPNSEEVLQAAGKDMEHSTIVSFICVLIVFFIRTKQNFKEFILERLPSDALKEATIVSRKFLEFASLTGGMPVTGILILSQTINKLQSMQSS